MFAEIGFKQWFSNSTAEPRRARVSLGVIDHDASCTQPRAAAPQITSLRARRPFFIFAYIDQTSFMSQPVLLTITALLR
jgi:hypothetical protein